jgi:hypothetical protein
MAVVVTRWRTNTAQLAIDQPYSLLVMEMIAKQTLMCTSGRRQTAWQNISQNSSQLMQKLIAQAK